MSIRHTATMPDGTIATRTSETRTYTHALATLWDPKHPGNSWSGVEDEGWGAYSWHGSHALAVKARNALVSRCGARVESLIVETQVELTGKHKRAAEAWASLGVKADR